MSPSTRIARGNRPAERTRNTSPSRATGPPKYTRSALPFSASTSGSTSFKRRLSGRLMMTLTGPPRCGCVTSTTASLKFGSRMAGEATRKMPLAAPSAATTGHGVAINIASAMQRRRTMELRMGPWNIPPVRMLCRLSPRSAGAARRHGMPMGLRPGASGDVATDGRGLSRLGKRRHRNAITNRGHLGKNGDRDLRRRLAADLQSDRAMQTRNFILRQIEPGKPPAARVIIFSGADRADVERRRLQRLEQRHVVELGVVRERDHRAVTVKIHRGDGVIRHAAFQFRAGNVPALRIFLARIADRD